MAHRKEDAAMTIKKAESRRQRQLEMLENKDFSNTTRMSREFYAILGPGDPKILSAMAMVMRISGTLCVLVLAGFLCLVNLVKSVSTQEKSNFPKAMNR